MKCNFCGSKNEKTAKYCIDCGNRLIDDSHEDKKEFQDYEIISPSQNKKDGDVSCPRCGSINIHFISKQVGSDFDATYGCCGFLLFGPLGILCGLFSDKETVTTRKCMKCGHEF